MKIQTVVRFVLTLILVYASYTETGPFTALALLLILAAIESQAWLTKFDRR